MSGLLEVIALTPEDARAIEGGGADRVELVGTMDLDGLSPAPEVVAAVRSATSLPIRVMLRLRDGFSTDGGEMTRLIGLSHAYADAGADGLVLGFLNGTGAVDHEVLGALAAGADLPWTFHRAIDAALDVDKAWAALSQHERIDTVLTAGSARGVEWGLDALVARARADECSRRMILAGGGLTPEHVPWLVRAGIRQFHVGSRARAGGSYSHGIDPELVGSWRRLIDAEVGHSSGPGIGVLDSTISDVTARVRHT